MADSGFYAANRVHLSQEGNLHLSGGQLYDFADVPVAQQVTFSPAKGGSSNICLVTIQFQDAAGNALTEVIAFDWWLSDAATGIGLTATTASGAVGAGASGTDLGVLTTKKATRSLTDATGKYILSITDTAKTGFYPAVSIPLTGAVAVGAQLTSGNYD